MSTAELLIVSDYLIDDLRPALSIKLKEMAEEASSMIVEDEENFSKVTSLYADAKRWEKQLEYVRKKANQPDQERIDERNSAAKEILVPLKEIQTVAKKKSEEYQEFLENCRKQAAEIIGAEDIGQLEPVKSDSASIYTRTVIEIQVNDLSKVPLKYLKIDESLVKQDIKAGIFYIPGIEISENKITQLRSR